MNPGDKKQIIYAIILGEGSDRLEAITNLRNNDDYIQMIYEGGFQTPEAIHVPQVKAVGLDEEIILTWDNKATLYKSAGYTFEGYNIYQLKAPDVNEPSNFKLIQTFDLKNDIFLDSEGFLEGKGDYLDMRDMQNYPNTGIRHFLKIDKNYLYDTVSRDHRLISGNKYYFVVSAL